MFPPGEGPLREFGIALRGSCGFSALGVLDWRGALGRGFLESYRSLSEERIESFVALLGTGATISGGDVFLPMPAKTVKAYDQRLELTGVGCGVLEVVASWGPGRVRENIIDQLTLEPVQRI